MSAKRRYPSRSYYEVLGVPRTAERGEIRWAYLQIKNHARTTGAASPTIETLNEAYEVLVDVEARNAYDAHLRQLEQPISSPPTRSRSGRTRDPVPARVPHSARSTTTSGNRRPNTVDRVGDALWFYFIVAVAVCALIITFFGPWPSAP